MKVRFQRDHLGFTQRELAARLGVYYKTVSRWECGKQRPSDEILRQIDCVPRGLTPIVTQSCTSILRH
jgi:transcriptional regulator with XRE-family HTH domain